MAPLQSPILLLIANTFGTIATGFGINAFLRPAHALSFFELDAPAPSTPERKLVDSLMYVYAIRDIFMGVAIYATSYFGDRKALGWLLLALSAVAFTDGAVCWVNGKGEWNHWGYAPMVGVLGGLVLNGN